MVFFWIFLYWENVDDYIQHSVFSFQGRNDEAMTHSPSQYSGESFLLCHCNTCKSFSQHSNRHCLFSSVRQYVYPSCTDFMVSHLCNRVTNTFLGYYNMVYNMLLRDLLVILNQIFNIFQWLSSVAVIGHLLHVSTTIEAIPGWQSQNFIIHQFTVESTVSSQ